MKLFLCVAFVVAVTVLATVAQAQSNAVSCVDITITEPCKGVTAGMYEICNMCDSGYFAICSESSTGVRTMSCPFIQDANGESRRMLYDRHSQSCLVESPSCPLQ